MTKRELQALLDQSGAGLMQCADELGLARSTVSRWRDQVPRYAIWYALARARLAPEERDRIYQITQGADRAPGDAA